ncbi:hypothetical protein [Nonomuraea sp. NPDC049784]
MDLAQVCGKVIKGHCPFLPYFAFKIASELPRNATGKVRKNLLVATVG